MGHNKQKQYTFLMIFVIIEKIQLGDALKA